MLFFIWHSLTFHIWKYTLDPENSTLIITNSEHHSVFFPYFIVIFYLAQPHFPYLEMDTGP
jgi:hypothetical protein